MSLQVIGAGVGRTGTTSLKTALERLLGGTCYHMWEVFGREPDIAVWHAAAEGEQPDWVSFFAEFTAAVDWPACSFQVEIAEAFPDALVLLSTRDSAETWWRSADNTILKGFRMGPPDDPVHRRHREMVEALFSATFTPDFLDAESAMAAYDAHNARVREVVAPERLLEWRPGDGWEPICNRLGLAVPDEPFPHANSTGDFAANIADRLDSDV